MKWDDAAYWEHVALNKKRAWLMPTRPSFPRYIGIGSDEYWRYTVWLGRLVVALWRIRPEWDNDIADAKARMDAALNEVGDAS